MSDIVRFDKYEGGAIRLLEDMLEDAKENGVSSIVVVTADSDKALRVEHNCDSRVVLSGLLSLAQRRVWDD